MHVVTFNPHVDHPGGCYSCRYFGHRVDVAVWCGMPGSEHVRSQAKRGCAFWQREPGADDELPSPRWPKAFATGTAADKRKLPGVDTMTRFTTFGLIAAVLASAPVVAQTDRSVVGFELGAPWRLAECPYETAPNGRRIYTFSPATTCWSDADMYGAGQFTATIVLPTGQSPSIVKAGYIHAFIRDGLLVGVDFRTHGINTQEFDLQTLTAKYGKPTKLGTSKVQNRMGAAYDSIEAIWLGQDLTVTFYGTIGTLNEGIVTVDLPAAADIRRAQAEKMDRILNPRKL